MAHDELLRLASVMPSYVVVPLYDSEGNVAPHFQDEIAERGWRFGDLMKDPMFAQIIEKELEGEHIANVSLAGLADMAPSEKVRRLILEWLGFLNADLQPWTTGGAIHFRPHWARVLMLALVLGEARGLLEDDLRALAMAAVFHDSRRKNPYMDTGHGDRAAEYYESFCERVALGGECKTPAGKAIRFDERTYMIIKWHDRDDADGIAAMRAAEEGSACSRVFLSKGSEGASCLSKSERASLDELYLLFKDADGLDRVRLGEGEPDIRFLRNQEAIDLLPFAHKLLDASMKLAVE